jgi:hypothetical protein
MIDTSTKRYRKDPSDCAIEYPDVYVSWNRNDLNPTGISKETCIKRVTENCGHIGQNACFDNNYKKDYCVEGWVGSGKCAPDS